MGKKTGNIWILCAVTAFLLAAQWFGIFQNVEYTLQDKHYQQGGLVSPEIYVIGIDEETLMEYGAWQEWGREKTAEIIRLFNEDEMYAPAVIALDIGFFGNSDPETDQALIDATSLLDNVVMTSYATFGKQIKELENGEFQMSEGVQTYEIPYEGLRDHVTWGFSNVPLDEDGIVRHSLYRIPMDGSHIYSFASEIYRKYMGELPWAAEYGSERGYIPFSGYPYDYYGSETEGISFEKILNGEIPKELFAGSIVLIGPYSAGMMDAYYTAVQHDTAMFGVEVHANILQAFLEDIAKIELGRAASLGITCLMAGIAVLGWFPKKLTIATLTSAAAGFGYWILSGKMYEYGYVLPLLYPLSVCAVIYISQIGFQYVQERKAKKQIQNVFGRYVPESVVSTIVKGGEETLKLGGQKKDIAVLFVDIRGFTPLSEGLDPEQVVEILNQYLDITTKAVFAQNGTVDKFIGDATMAIYNAPLDLDDYVLRAVKTGLQMGAASNAIADEMERKTGRKVGLGIGINCGEAVIGNIGTSKRMEYTAIGSTVNAAARLEGIAKAGEVIISSNVYERLKGRIHAVSLGERQLKGIAEPMEVFRVESVIDESNETV